MKRIISAVLMVSITLGASTAAYANTMGRAAKPKSSKLTANPDYRTDSFNNKLNYKAATAKRAGAAQNPRSSNNINALDKSRKALIKKCDDMLEQVSKLKSYIVDDKNVLLVEFNDEAAATSVLRSISDAVNGINSYKQRIEDVKTNKELNAISKELKDNLNKHQTMVKRITGLTNAARLKKTYNQIKEIMDRLGQGINAISGNKININTKAIKDNYNRIKKNLDKAYDNYQDAVAMFSSITDSRKADKYFREAQKTLEQANKGMRNVLADVKKLLVKIKSGALRNINIGMLEIDEKAFENGFIDY